MEVQTKAACHRYHAKKKKKNAQVLPIFQWCRSLVHLTDGSSREEETMEAVSVIKQRRTHPLMAFRLHQHRHLMMTTVQPNNRRHLQSSQVFTIRVFHCIQERKSADKFRKCGFRLVCLFCFCILLAKISSTFPHFNRLDCV